MATNRNLARPTNWCLESLYDVGGDDVDDGGAVPIMVAAVIELVDDGSHVD